MTALSEKWSETMDANEDIQKICDQVKPQVEKMAVKKYEEFKAVKYRNQVEKGGQNYLIKVYVGEDYIHLSLSREVDGKVMFSGVHQHKTKEDPLVPFVN